MIKKHYHKKTLVQMERTLQEVGDELGCTASAVEQVERRALVKVTRMIKERFGDTVTLDDILPSIRYSLEEIV